MMQFWSLEAFPTWLESCGRQLKLCRHVIGSLDYHGTAHPPRLRPRSTLLANNRHPS